MKEISLNSLGTIVAMVVSAVSMLFTWQQMEIAKDQTHLSRKSLLIEKKLQVCLDFLTTASEFEFSFKTQSPSDIARWSMEEQVLPKSGTGGVLEALKAAGYLSNSTENSASELAKITARARLLLRAATAEKMQFYADNANKAYGEQILRLFKKTGNKTQGWGSWLEPLPTSEADQLNSLRSTANQIESLCGELAEREAS
jgi:hypothetical protein